MNMTWISRRHPYSPIYSAFPQWMTQFSKDTREPWLLSEETEAGSFLNKRRGRLLRQMFLCPEHCGRKTERELGMRLTWLSWKLPQPFSFPTCLSFVHAGHSQSEATKHHPQSCITFQWDSQRLGFFHIDKQLPRSWQDKSLILTRLCPFNLLEPQLPSCIRLGALTSRIQKGLLWERKAQQPELWRAWSSAFQWSV